MDGAKRKGARYVPASVCVLLCAAAGGPGSEVDLPRRLQRLITEAESGFEMGSHVPAQERKRYSTHREASEEFAFGRQADAHEALMLLLSRWLNGCVKAESWAGASSSGSTFLWGAGDFRIVKNGLGSGLGKGRRRIWRLLQARVRGAKGAKRSEA